MMCVFLPLQDKEQQTMPMKEQNNHYESKRHDIHVQTRGIKFELEHVGGVLQFVPFVAQGCCLLSTRREFDGIHQA